MRCATTGIQIPQRTVCRGDGRPHQAQRSQPVAPLHPGCLATRCALSRVPPQNTAFGDRSAPYLIGIEANWERPEDDAACIDWGREVFRALELFSSDREYFNFPGLYEESDKSVRNTFGANLGRLQSVKRKYDPDNLFRLNHNIPPAEPAD